jgi:hypothetical protein
MNQHLSVDSKTSERFVPRLVGRHSVSIGWGMSYSYGFQ